MASGFLVVEGLDTISSKLKKLDGNIIKVCESMLASFLIPIENKMKTNAVTMFNKGFSKGIMVKSISHTVVSKPEVEWVGGSVGVFDMSAKTGDYGIVSGRPVTAPMIAQFYEAGIQPHFTTTGTRAEQRPTLGQPRGRRAKFGKDHDNLNELRRSKGKDEVKMHPGTAPIPFLSGAWESLAPSGLQRIEEELDKQILAML